MKYFLITLRTFDNHIFQVKKQGVDQYNAMMHAELSAVNSEIDVDPTKSIAKEISLGEYVKSW